MAHTADQAQVQAAEGYESLLVPALFKFWTEPVLDAADVVAGDHVLDVACGTGVLARDARRRAGPNGRVAGLDPGRGMLTVATRLDPSVEWREGAAEDIPWPDKTFDAVISQFGLMFFSDRRLAAAEMARVLKPGGRMAVAVWDDLEQIPAYADEVSLLEREAGPEAADGVRIPFALGDPDYLATLFRRAGVSSVDVSTESGKGTFPSVHAMLQADLRGWLPLIGIELEEDTIQRVLDEAEDQLAPYIREDGRVVFDVSVHIVTGTGTGS